MRVKNLLIVDDEPLLVMNLKFLLQDLADNIFTAGNGKEGLEILKSHEIHCVISDISMPIMSGVEFIREVRAQGMEIPFIFYTAYGHQELMLEVAKYGAYDYLKKPFLDGLEDAVTRGINEGFNRSEFKKPSEGDIISEYQQILESLERIRD